MTSAINGLQAYKQWRAGIKALPIGTVVKWIVGYQASTESMSIKAGGFFKILEVLPGIGMSNPNGIGNGATPASMTYKMVLVSKLGKQHKRITYWNVENIARKLEANDIIVVN